MLGDNITADGWPKCGEIDIKENVGKGTGNQPWLAAGPKLDECDQRFDENDRRLARGKRLWTIFHLSRWSGNRVLVRFNLDSNLYGMFTSAQWPAAHVGVRPFRFS